MQMFALFLFRSSEKAPESLWLLCEICFFPPPTGNGEIVHSDNFCKPGSGLRPVHTLCSQSAVCIAIIKQMDSLFNYKQQMKLNIFNWSCDYTAVASKI